MVRQLRQTIRAGMAHGVTLSYPPELLAKVDSFHQLHDCDIGYPMVTGDAGPPLVQKPSMLRSLGTAEAQPFASLQGTSADIAVFNKVDDRAYG